MRVTQDGGSTDTPEEYVSRIETHLTDNSVLSASDLAKPAEGSLVVYGFVDDARVIVEYYKEREVTILHNHTQRSGVSDVTAEYRVE